MQSSGEAREMADDSLSTSIFKVSCRSRICAMGRVLPFRYALAVGALIIISFCLTMMALSNNQEANTIFTDIASFSIDVLVTLALFYCSLYCYFHGKRIYLAWLILAIARLDFTIADAIWAYTEIVLQESPFPSMADYFYIAHYPLFLLGIFFLPSIKFTSSERLKMMLDTGIVMISAILVFWSLIIAPTIQESGDIDASLSRSFHCISCSGFGFALCGPGVDFQEDLREGTDSIIISCWRNNHSDNN